MSYEKIYKMPFRKLYDSLLSKALKKERTQAEVDKIICWLTGYSVEELQTIKESDINYADFFQKAPCLNPNRKLITGKICGVRLEEMTVPLDREIRYLDKLIDELAKGKSMDKILRKEK